MVNRTITALAIAGVAFGISACGGGGGTATVNVTAPPASSAYINNDGILVAKGEGEAEADFNAETVDIPGISGDVTGEVEVKVTAGINQDVSNIRDILINSCSNFNFYFTGNISRNTRNIHSFCVKVSFGLALALSDKNSVIINVSATGWWCCYIYRSCTTTSTTSRNPECYSSDCQSCNSSIYHKYLTFTPIM